MKPPTMIRMDNNLVQILKKKTLNTPLINTGSESKEVRKIDSRGAIINLTYTIKKKGIIKIKVNIPMMT